ncbi:hypothetical protein ACJRO7_018012 [Eucalyptus globulus]|uniref:Uncharacterized protein n=1 Tax=Eucalyptus globulus TaxID=34317 RepID=A0ABD3KWJ3_EUCGL
MHSSSTSNDVPQSSSAGSFSLPESSDQNNQAPATNTFDYYDFLPSKAAEDAERAQNIPREVERKPVKIQDEDPLPRSDSHDHPTLYKVIDEFDLWTEKPPARDDIALDSMFPLHDDMDCNHGGSGGDNNGVNGPLHFRGLNVYFGKCQRTGHYFLNLSDVLVARQIKVGNIILFRWDTQKGCFVIEIVSIGT